MLFLRKRINATNHKLIYMFYDYKHQINFMNDKYFFLQNLKNIFFKLKTFILSISNVSVTSKELYFPREMIFSKKQNTNLRTKEQTNIYKFSEIEFISENKNMSDF